MTFGTVVIGEGEIDIALLHCTAYESVGDELYRPSPVELDTPRHFGNAQSQNQALSQFDFRFPGTCSGTISSELLLQNFKPDSRHSIEKAFSRDKISDTGFLPS